MNTPYTYAKKAGEISSLALIVVGFATVFYPRFFTNLGFPSPLNFAHFIIIPAITIIVLLNSPLKERAQRKIMTSLSFAIGGLLIIMMASALLNQAGLVNVFIYFMLLAEPYIFLVALAVSPLLGQQLIKFRRWIIIFTLSNLGIALAQWILIPAGIIPKPQGGTLEDNITGVFGGGGGSAGNYISCTVTVYVGLYVFNRYKNWPLWLRSSLLLGGVFQTQISDSKQVFVGLLGGGILLVLTKYKNLGKLVLYAILLIAVIAAGQWAIFNLDYEFLSPYRNWLGREGLYGPNGEATLIKTAAFRIIPTHFTSLVNWLFGLGPGHSVSRLGGWILRDYARLLVPLGATVHPASAEVFNLVYESWLPQQSTMYFPLFTWAGLWGDLGFLGLFSYLFLAFIAWRWFCVDDMCKFFVLSTAAFGFILTQMEEPGQVVTVAVLLGLRWHETQVERQAIASLIPHPKVEITNPFKVMRL
ncbi:MULTISPECIES: hypothetical protein [Cyanophyceae]|uniref:Uncharacterized protein n=1 Tax=Leptolyngbya subtilissima DQ-A4 TaxID=2933933 RepID=A0ABV0JZT7_9CYAN|nr:hypothetical protein [Nodosilinea sp. FACHB-141]MBD2112395.1 hypothetical protein [Nodosilinea sp. FACHB-141]